MDFKQTSIKQSALGWVKKSIDEHLTTIRSDLTQYIEENDAEKLNNVEQQLILIQGVLNMIEQFGAAVLTEEMAALARYIGNKAQKDQSALEVLLRAVLQLPDYLEHIQAGQKDIPIAILPLLNDIRASRNEDLFSEKLLFLPDLSMHRKSDEVDSIEDIENQKSRALAKKVRPAFQFSLLGLIQEKELAKNLQRLDRITEVMEERAITEQLARFWWIVGALIESVQRDDLPLGVSVKMLLGKIDQVLRTLILRGESEVIQQQPVDLIKNLLYYIAQPECDGPKSASVKTAYRLERFLPAKDSSGEQSAIAGPNLELLKTVSEAIKSDLEKVKAELEVYVNTDLTDTAPLSGLPSELHVISDTLTMIGLGAQRQQVENQIKMIQQVLDKEIEPRSEQFLSMAAELIQVEQALDMMHKGFYAEDIEQAGSEVASHNFEMENMLSGVVTAALDDIHKVKDALLDFLKDKEKSENLDFCITLLGEIRGALDVLNEHRAAEMVHGLVEYLQNGPEQEFFEEERLNQLSEVVVSIEYYLEALGEQRADTDSILDFADHQLTRLFETKQPFEEDFEEHENLLIDDGEVEHVNEAELESVNLDHMEIDLGDGEMEVVHQEVEEIQPLPDSQPPQEFTSEDVSEPEVTGEPEVNQVVEGINADLEEIQDVLVVPEEPLDTTDTFQPVEQSPAGAEADSYQPLGYQDQFQPHSMDSETSDISESENVFLSAGPDEAVEQSAPLQGDSFQPATDFEQPDEGIAENIESVGEADGATATDEGFESDQQSEEAFQEPVQPFQESTLDETPSAEGEITTASEDNQQEPEPEAYGFEVERVVTDEPVLKPGSDPDILEIYLEEAEEEAENIRQQQQDWKLHPEDGNALGNIRRSFHTIKGSGRLVGAMKIGEFAWDYESLLNRVIDKTIPPSDLVIDAVGQAAEALPGLVNELKGQGAAEADIPYLRGLARMLARFDAQQVMQSRKSQPASVSEVPVTENADESDNDVAETASEIIDPEVTTENSLQQSETGSEEVPHDPFEPPKVSEIPGGEVEVLLPETQIDQIPSEDLVPDDPAVMNQDQENSLQLDPELLVIYQQEIESHLSTVNSVLDEIEADGSFKPNEALYRAIHTINGASRTAEIKTVGELATLLEKPLKEYLEKGQPFDAKLMMLFRSGHDAISSMATELVRTRELPGCPQELCESLQQLINNLEDQTVELEDMSGQSSDHFVDTLTMMNEVVESDVDEELVEIFIEEAMEILESSDRTLQNWREVEPADYEAGHQHVMEMQRLLHTLKGGSRMADFMTISDLSHELESLFIAVIDRRVSKDEHLLETVQDAFDFLSRQVEQAQAHQPIDDPDQPISALRELRGQKPKAKPQADKSSTVEESADSSQPEPVEVDSDNATDEMPQQAETVADTQAPADKTVEPAASEREVVRVRSDLLDNLVNSAGEVSIYRARMEQQVSSFGSHLGELGQTISRLKAQLRSLEAETDAQIHYSHRVDEQKGPDHFDPLEMDRYTHIQELSKSLGESVDDLSSLQAMLGDQVKDSETLLLQQSRINTDLQEGLIRSRMVRFSGLNARLRRIVRKTSGELGKKAELEIVGDHHELDIKVLDRMVAPIEHILRNALSHGIETPEVRLNKGKTETGKVRIEVSRDGSDIVLTIRDDGAGVNVDKVRARAIELGKISAREEVNDQDVIQFILDPGFSTAEKVTQVSGRGVGMDVVDQAIKQLGGSLQISTSPKGTVFTARLPFTLSINQALLVRAGEESYALPLINIEGITRIEAEQMAEYYQQEKPMFDYLGQQYQLYYLTQLLDNQRSFYVQNPTEKMPVILLRFGEGRVAIHIDEMFGNREIVVKPLGRLLSPVKGISGASILADGLVVLILDINGLIHQGKVQWQSASEITASGMPAGAERKRVMVVDDSITMRRVASKLLSRNGYEVVTAKDGVDALAQLQEVIPDVMLLDIEMPRMDGFELASHMKNEQRYRAIPIIMITSRTGSKHRDHAASLGVNKYMGKPYQENELMSNIVELTG